MSKVFQQFYKDYKKRPGGTSQNYIIHLTAALFKKIQMFTGTDEYGSLFIFFDCWKALKDHPNFYSSSAIN